MSNLQSAAARSRVRACDWRPEEDAVIRDHAARGANWIQAYRLPHRTVHAIASRRRTIENAEGIRLPRFRVIGCVKDALRASIEGRSA